jgi:Prophage minor tail protein Z (GPZ)
MPVDINIVETGKTYIDFGVGFNVKLVGYDKALKIFDEKPVRKAALTSLRKVSASAKSTASEEVRNVYSIKKSDLDPRMKGPNIQFDGMTACIVISGSGISLSYFNARQTAANRVVTRGKAGLKTKTMKRSARFQGTSVEVLKGKRTQLKSAFMATMASGHVGVMYRTGAGMIKSRSRYGYNKHSAKIAEDFVISLSSMVKKNNVQEAVVARVNEQWVKVFPHELNRQLGLEK